MTADLGRDLSCVTDCTPDFQEVTGRVALAQSIARRLISPRGCMLDDPEYGYDLTAFVNADMGPRDLAAAQAGAEAQCLLDERVVSASVTVTLSEAGEMAAVIDLTDADGPFQFTLSASDAGAAITEIST